MPRSSPPIKLAFVNSKRANEPPTNRFIGSKTTSAPLLPSSTNRLIKKMLALSLRSPQHAHILEKLVDAALADLDAVAELGS